MEVAGIVTGAIFLLIINYCFADKAAECAEAKGYNRSSWFHACFWLGIISYILVAALPDQILRNKQDETNRLLEQVLATQGIIPADRVKV